MAQKVWAPVMERMHPETLMRSLLIRMTARVRPEARPEARSTIEAKLTGDGNQTILVLETRGIQRRPDLITEFLGQTGLTLEPEPP
jgi:hypothetical protein